MRRPKTPGDAPPADTPPGGHAKDRARHFAQQRGLPPPPEGEGAGLPDEPAAPHTPHPPPPPPPPTTKKR